MLCDLAVGLADPVERLTSVHAQMAKLNESSRMPKAGNAVVFLRRAGPAPMLVGDTHASSRSGCCGAMPFGRSPP